MYIDPVCFLPSFGSYLRYGFDHHLVGWRDLVDHVAARHADPAEPMTLFNMVLASWFIKVRSRGEKRKKDENNPTTTSYTV